ncbi:MAG: site-specific integrase, partial [Gemmatimonadetes bacterium]|nr:site-specific integrase [Gemmatimonadota bacterium]
MSEASSHDERAFHMEQFHDYLTFERGLAARTVQAYERDLRRWLHFVTDAGIRAPQDVSVALLRGWMFELKNAGLAPTSIRRAQSALRTYHGFLLAEGVIETDPTDRLDSPNVQRKLPDFLTREETERLLDAPDPDHPTYWRDLAMLEFLYATGVRVSELVDLRLSALELEEGFATVFGKGS